MSRRLTVALGERRIAAPAPSALSAAIHQQLHAGTRVRRAGGFAASALSLALLPAFASQAAMITVDDAGGTAVAADLLCTLPEAVANANADADTSGGDCAAGSGLDQIVFDPALAAATINLGATLPVTAPLSIDGAAAPDLRLQSGGPIRLVDADADLTLANISLYGGFADQGGAIHSGAALALENVSIEEAEAKYGGGAVYAAGPLTVTNSRFYGNTAGKYAEDIGHGGAILARDTLTVTDSLFVGNQAYGAGGAIFAGAGGSIAGSLFAYNEGYFGGAVFGGDPTTLLAPEPAVKGVVAPAAISLAVSDSGFYYNRAGAADSSVAYLYGAGGALAFIPRGSTDGSLAHALTIAGSRFEQNAAAPDDGGPRPEAAKGIYGSMTVGGALAVLLAPSGSGVAAKGTVAQDALSFGMDDSTLDSNFALIGGGAMVTASTITVDGSTFESNTGLVGGGAWLGQKYGKYAAAGAANTSIALTDTGFLYNQGAAMAGLTAGAATVQASGLSVLGNIAGVPAGKYAAQAGAKGEYGKYVPEFTCTSSGSNKYVGGALFAGNSVTLSGSNEIANNCAGEVAGLGLIVAQDGMVGAGTSIHDNEALSSYAYAGGALIAADGGGSVLFQGSVSGNHSAGDGGGLALATYYGGSIVVDGASISGNSAGQAGGGVLVQPQSSVTVANSTLSGNSAAAGGGLYVDAAPAVTAAKGVAASVILRNATMHGNAAALPAAQVASTLVPGSGGGIAVADGGVLTVQFGTVTGNTAGAAGGGLWVAPAATVTLASSILAENSAAADPDLAGTASADYTLVQSVGGATLAGGNNQTGVDPLLGPLQDNGGPTLTRAPLPGSPVVNGGDPGFVPPPDTDQRGAGFPRVQNGIVDKGAVEAPAPQVVAITLDPAVVAEGASGTLTVTLDAATGVPVLATVAFTGVALAGTDFTVADADAGLAGIQVAIPAGSSSGTATLDATDDALDEADEGFTATVTAATNADLSGTVATAGTIGDGDAPPTVTLSLSQASIVEEGGSTSITATLSAPSAQDVTITLGFSGSATQGSDYSVTGTQIVIPAGQTSGSVLLSTIDDGVDEGDETVVVDILAVSNGLESGTQQGTVVIDDTADGSAQAPGAIPQPTVIPTLSEWMLMLLGLLLPATVVARLRRSEAPARRR